MHSKNCLMKCFKGIPNSAFVIAGIAMLNFSSISEVNAQCAPGVQYVTDRNVSLDFKAERGGTYNEVTGTICNISEDDIVTVSSLEQLNVGGSEAQADREAVELDAEQAAESVRQYGTWTFNGADNRFSFSPNSGRINSLGSNEVLITSFVVEVSNAVTQEIVATNTVTMTIQGPDPVLSVSSLSDSIGSDGNARFVISAGSPTGSSFSLNYNVAVLIEGDRVLTFSNQRLTFGSGRSCGVVSITGPNSSIWPTDNQSVENSEEGAETEQSVAELQNGVIEFSLASGDGYYLSETSSESSVSFSGTGDGSNANVDETHGVSISSNLGECSENESESSGDNSGLIQTALIAGGGVAAAGALVFILASGEAGTESASCTNQPDVESEANLRIPILSISNVTTSGDVVEGFIGEMFQIEADISRTGPLTISYTLQSRGDFLDLSHSPSETITLNAGGTDVTARIVVRTTDDRVNEDAGEITAEISDATGTSPAYCVSPTAGSSTVTVLDNDGFQVSLADPQLGSPVIEGNTMGVLVRLNSVSRVDFEILVEVADPMQLLATDPDQTGERMVTLPAGEREVRFGLLTADDNIHQSGGVVTISLPESSNYNISPVAGTVNIEVTNDDFPTISMDLGRMAMHGGEPAVYEGSAIPIRLRTSVLSTSSFFVRVNFVGPSDDPARLPNTINPEGRTVRIEFPAMQRTTTHSFQTSVVDTVEAEAEITLTLMAGEEEDESYNINARADNEFTVKWFDVPIFSLHALSLCSPQFEGDEMLMYVFANGHAGGGAIIPLPLTINLDFTVTESNPNSDLFTNAGESFSREVDLEANLNQWVLSANYPYKDFAVDTVSEKFPNASFLCPRNSRALPKTIDRITETALTYEIELVEGASGVNYRISRENAEKNFLANPAPHHNIGFQFNDDCNRDPAESICDPFYASISLDSRHDNSTISQSAGTVWFRIDLTKPSASTDPRRTRAQRSFNGIGVMITETGSFLASGPQSTTVEVPGTTDDPTGVDHVLLPVTLKAADANSDPDSTITVTLQDWTGSEREREYFLGSALPNLPNVRGFEPIAAGAPQTIITATVTVEDAPLTSPAPPITEFGQLSEASAPPISGLNVEGQTPAPTISVTASRDLVYEGEVAQFELTADIAPLQNTEVNIEIGDSRALIANQPPLSVRLEAGNESAMLNIPINPPDLIPDEDGHISVKIIEGDGYRVSGTDFEAGVTVIDREGHRLTDHISELNESVIPEVLFNMAGTSSQAIANQVNLAFSGERANNIMVNGMHSLPSHIIATGDAVNKGDLELQDLLDNSEFSLNLTPGDFGSNSIFIWGNGEILQLTGKGGQHSRPWDGEMSTGHFGFDVDIGDNMLAGTAISLNSGTTDFESELNFVGSDEMSTRSGGVSIEALTIQPFLGVNHTGLGSNFWVSPGIGSGDIEYYYDSYRSIEQHATVDYFTVSSGGTSLLYASNSEPSEGLVELHMVGEGWISEMQLEGRGSFVQNTTIKSNQVKISAVGTYLFQDQQSQTLDVKKTVGLQLGNSNKLNQSGISLSGEANFVHLSNVSLSGSGSILVKQQGHLENWKLNSSLNFDERGNGRGVQIDLSSYWGNQTQQLYGLTSADDNDNSSILSVTNIGIPKFSIELGYGVNLPEENILLTPYGEFEFASTKSHEVSAGGRLNHNRGIRFDVKGTQTNFSGQESVYGLRMGGSANF